MIRAAWPWRSAASWGRCRKSRSRRWRKLRRRTRQSPKRSPPRSDLIATLKDADDWDRVAETPQEQAKSGPAHPRPRAGGGTVAGAEGGHSAEALRGPGRTRAPAQPAQALDVSRLRRRHGHCGRSSCCERRRRSSWRASSCGATIRSFARSTILSTRPRVSWTDFRVKMVIFPALEKHPGADDREALPRLSRPVRRGSAAIRPAAVRGGGEDSARRPPGDGRGCGAVEASPRRRARPSDPRLSAAGHGRLGQAGLVRGRAICSGVFTQVGRFDPSRFVVSSFHGVHVVSFLRVLVK